jgi:hypothetical protein
LVNLSTDKRFSLCCSKFLNVPLAKPTNTTTDVSNAIASAKGIIKTKNKTIIKRKDEILANIMGTIIT